MAEPRKIVLILGNGFDLDLGLKTSYKDFWESEYCPKDYPAPLIHHLNQRWPNNKESVRWYDLENELLEYYKSIRNPHIGDEYITPEEKGFLADFIPANCHFGMYYEQNDIIQALIDKGVIKYHERPIPTCSVPYKEDVYKSPIERDKKAIRLIKEELCNYLKAIYKNTISVNNKLAYRLLHTIRRSSREGDYVSIYSFNYTPIRLPGYSLDNIPIYYMHGESEKGKIIVGTRYDPIIVPEYDFLVKAMDDFFSPPDIVTALKESDEVIVFGHSLGENDRQYFAPFFKRQSNEDTPIRKDITIITRDYQSQKEIKRALQIMTDGHLSSLFSINQPKIIKTANLDEDKKLFYDFLINHYTEEFAAQQILSELLKQHN